MYQGSSIDDSIASLLSVNKYKKDKKTPNAKPKPTTIAVPQKMETEGSGPNWFIDCTCMPAEKGNLSIRAHPTTLQQP